MIDEELMARDIVRRKAADFIYDSAVKTEPKPPRRPRPRSPPRAQSRNTRTNRAHPVKLILASTRKEDI